MHIYIDVLKLMNLITVGIAPLAGLGEPNRQINSVRTIIGLLGAGIDLRVGSFRTPVEQ